MQTAIGCCILLLLVPKMVFSLCNLCRLRLSGWLQTCTGGVFPLPTRHLLMCTHAREHVLQLALCGGGGCMWWWFYVVFCVCVCVRTCVCLEVWLAHLCGSQCCRACPCALVHLHAVHDGLYLHTRSPKLRTNWSQYNLSTWAKRLLLCFSSDITSVGTVDPLRVWKRGPPHFSSMCQTLSLDG